jgi:Ca2+-binding RTX toxin-like protein
MIRRFLVPLALLALLVVIVVGVVSAVAAGNSVPPTRLGSTLQSITANNLMPSQCSALTLADVVVCPATGNCNGTNANDLILGNAAANTINGRNGNDCIVGGGGNDTINGGNGTDVCIGGAGTDTFTNCETVIQ